MTPPNRRALAADATRRAILQAGRDLFAERGYAATRIADIAERAGVSPQTIYDSVGSKAAIVGGLNDLIDETADIGDLVAVVMSSDDPRRLVEVGVAIPLRFIRSGGDVLRTLMRTSEPEIAAVYAESMRRHRLGGQRIAGRIAALGGLRPDVNEARAAQTLSGLTEPSVVFTFVDGYGWPLETYEAWAVETVSQLVLAPKAKRR